MEEYKCPLLSISDRIRKDLQKYETVCFCIYKTRTVESLLEEIVKYYGGGYRGKIEQALKLVSEVLDSEREDAKTIKECLLYGNELPKHL